MTDEMMTTKKMIEQLANGIVIQVTGSLDRCTRDSITDLCYALRSLFQHCDAIGDSGEKCTLRAGHPGGIHEEYKYGETKRFRLESGAPKAEAS